MFYGANNANLQMLKSLLPKLRINARGNVIRVLGDEEEICSFEENIENIRLHLIKFNKISEEDMALITEGNIKRLLKI